jgi:ribulose-5-phosphate 4-epimerase/fuculose-1-phosphate aldolase
MVDLRSIVDVDARREQATGHIREDLKEVVAASARYMWDRKLTWGRDAGDSSLRDPSTGLIYILQKPSSQHPIPTWAVATADYVAVVDIDGVNVGDPEVEPTIELLTHLRIYQHRSDVNAIVHSHGEWSTIYAGIRQPVPTMLIDSFYYLGMAPVPCSIMGKVGGDEVAMSCVERLGDYGKAVLLASHGAATVGADLDEALGIAELVEQVSRQAIYANVIGRPIQLVVQDLFDIDEADLREHPEKIRELTLEA